MVHSDALRWNKRYASDRDSWLSRSPRALLIDNLNLLPHRGLALDAAAGVAPNGLLLAERGFHVIALDISETGLQMAMQRARSIKVNLEAAVYDLSTPWLPPNLFDVITNFHFLERATFPMFRQALKHGGILFFETFVKTESFDKTSHPTYYLESQELKSSFQDWEIVYWDQRETASGKRNKKHVKVIEQIIARKP